MDEKEKEDESEGSSSSSDLEETVIKSRMNLMIPLPKKVEKEPNYHDESFVPKNFEEKRAMMLARAKKEAEDEEEQHRKRVGAARLKAQAELELKKAETLEKLRKQRQAREQKENMKEMIRRKSFDDDNENFFADIKNMNAQLMERAEEFKASLEEQERKGMIMLRPRASAAAPNKQPLRRSSSSSDSDSS